jgi:ribosomal protein S18 acetylase RimI-like enzyme
MNGPVLTYRNAVAGDRDWLFELKKATMRNYVAAVYGWDDEVQRRWFNEKFDPVKIRIIQRDGHDAGLLQVEETSGHVFLAQVEILPTFQNQGVGSAVIRAVIEDAKRKNKPVLLQVLRPNPARRLYQRLGFSVWAENATHFKMRKETNDAVGGH